MHGERKRSEGDRCALGDATSSSKRVGKRATTVATALHTCELECIAAEVVNPSTPFAAHQNADARQPAVEPGLFARLSAVHDFSSGAYAVHDSSRVRGLGHDVDVVGGDALGREVHRIVARASVAAVVCETPWQIGKAAQVRNGAVPVALVQRVRSRASSSSGSAPHALSAATDEKSAASVTVRRRAQ